ncbi:GAF domain-containing protein [Cnuella takakiae]|uniref:histidine kinase n=1 Tax=Cnuella takakiae TaxID=1302690 RepID=A0A1M4X966_9BACT|nr:ATP-binding protein [Cnuella takakiae]OLY94685.1 hypothetical protein BUE76_05940 [Cnuella takakiae]SHE90060.1 GAF domain-containing protein [Cnuella takakiae]
MENTFGVPIIPHNDLQRVTALRRYNILDSAPEQSFTNIVQLASEFFNVPIALISLVDTTRVHFKANVGLGNMLYEDRGKSLCSLAVLNDKATVFENALEEPNLVYHPLVTGSFGLRFYAGAPLISSDGFNIGTLCIIDKQPRSFGPKQARQLEQFAAIAMNDIELRLAARNKTKELEAKVAERTNALTMANEDLKRSNEELEQFAYVASHDLQEPLRRIMTFSRLLNDRYADSVPSEALSHLNVIDTAAGRMSIMVRDVLNYARVNRDAHSIRLVDLNEVMAMVRKNLETTIAGSAAVIECGELPAVKGNTTQLQQVFTNLLTNALKFQVQDAVPHIHIHTQMVAGPSLPAYVDLPTDKSYCCIKVRDNGIGFNPEHSVRIFQLFQRLHSNSKYQGTGIGLALCKKILKHHGGDILAFSQLGKGAEFQMWLPMAV